MKYFLLLSLVFSLSAQAKRAAPAEIKPLRRAGNTYVIQKDVSDCKDKDKVCGMTVSLVSSKTKDKSENWKRELYIKHYDMNEERDVQEIHPKSMKFEKSRIKVIDEKGSEYLIEAENGKMIKPLKTILYMAKP